MDERECAMKFHVTDSVKPLASAMAMVKMGNRIVLENGHGKSYIENIKNGDKIILKEVGGTFMFEVKFPEKKKDPPPGFTWRGWL